MFPRRVVSKSRIFADRMIDRLTRRVGQPEETAYGISAPCRTSLFPFLPHPEFDREACMIGACRGHVKTIRQLVHTRRPSDFHCLPFLIPHRHAARVVYGLSKFVMLHAFLRNLTNASQSVQELAGRISSMCKPITLLNFEELRSPLNLNMHGCAR